MATTEPEPRSDGDREWTEREVPRSTARNFLDLIRTHATTQDGYIFPCEVAFDGTRVEAIGYGKPPLDGDGRVDETKDREAVHILAIVVDDELAEQITLLADEEDSDGEADADGG